MVAGDAAQRWSDDEILDRLRREADPLADEIVRELHEEHGLEASNRVFQLLTHDHQALPDDAPEPLRRFMNATCDVPPGFDEDRLERGAKVFRTHIFPATVILLASSLPCGYSAPCLSRVLTMSNNLGQHPYKRLMGVVQLIVNVSSHLHRHHDDGRILLSAQKLRLLHAGIRYLVPKHRPQFHERFGVPVNHEDMLATIMGFSFLVIEGLETLGVGLTQEEAEDFYFVWKLFAQMMGIHPEGQPESDAYVPENVAAARVFYRSYERRHYTTAAENPDGVELARYNLQMMEDLIPAPLRRLGLGKAPRIAMHELLGDEGMARVGLELPEGHNHHGNEGHGHLVGLLRKTTRGLGGFMADHLGLVIFQHMIDVNREGEVRFLIPPDLETIRREL